MCSGPVSAGHKGTLDDLLGKMSLHDHPTANTDTAPVGTGEAALKIVDFVPSAMVAEEEVALGGGVTLKLQSKLKLEKVSPALWIPANARIMRVLMKRPDFELDNYLNYTEMIGKLATRYTWQSVLMFDTEYRQCQAARKSTWGDQAPHLSTVILRDRPLQTTPLRRQASGSGQRQRPTGPSGRGVPSVQQGLLLLWFAMCFRPRVFFMRKGPPLP